MDLCEVSLSSYIYRYLSSRTPLVAIVLASAMISSDQKTTIPPSKIPADSRQVNSPFQIGLKCVGKDAHLPPAFAVCHPPKFDQAGFHSAPPASSRLSRVCRARHIQAQLCQSNTSLPIKRLTSRCISSSGVLPYLALTSSHRTCLMSAMKISLDVFVPETGFARESLQRSTWRE